MSVDVDRNVLSKTLSPASLSDAGTLTDIGSTFAITQTDIGSTSISGGGSTRDDMSITGKDTRGIWMSLADEMADTSAHGRLIRAFTASSGGGIVSMSVMSATREVDTRDISRKSASAPVMMKPTLINQLTKHLFDNFTENVCCKNQERRTI